MSEDEAGTGAKASGAKADYYSGPQAGDFAQAAEPFTLFAEWFAQAQAHEPNDPNAMALATATPDDAPVLGRMLAMANGIATAQGSPDGFRIIINTGRVGHQEVPHLHIHIVGGPDPVGPMLKRI